MTEYQSTPEDPHGISTYLVPFQGNGKPCVVTQDVPDEQQDDQESVDDV